jgi:para-aminobenzoate synthetase component 1
MGQNTQPEALQDLITRMNALGARRTPFLFVLDYALHMPLVIPMNEVHPGHILYDLNGMTNISLQEGPSGETVNMVKEPVNIRVYREAFNGVMAELEYGNSYLLNLTFPTPIGLNITLRQVFHMSKAKYRLLVEGKGVLSGNADTPEAFVVFSPESFVQIREGRISAFPMKGTIDAAIPDARQRILGNQKEKAEHITIVDLLRNDLSRVASDVRVDRFRYVEEVRTHEKTLLQVSSEISGRLPDDYHQGLGSVLCALLPAGSVTGAPKVKTVEILNRVETYDRGYFSGICGYFDGHKLDSGVMIRFIEQRDGNFVFKSGGGITTQSVLDEEYQEMIDKVYVPIH